MSMLKILLVVCIFAGMLIPGKRALHMFQQNRYECGRYTGWINENIVRNVRRNTFAIGLCAAGFVLGAVLKGALGILVQCALILVYTFMEYTTEQAKKYIKPLVYTDRVKRQIAVMAVLAAVIALPVAFAGGKMFAVISAVLLPWGMIYPMAWITSPIEAGVRNKFLNEAKQILKDHPGLTRIGITGSFGKTTTKNIMQAMVGEAYNSLMTPASYNTPMGITRTIRELLKPIHEVFVCEMGADHVGDIVELMDFVHPTIGVVTSVGPQHLNTFGSQENITKEKMQIIEMLPADGFGIMNYDNEFIRGWKVQNSVETVTYGIHHEDVDYRAADISYSRTGSSFTVVHGDERVQIETKLLGELNILNILSAIAAARHLGVAWPVIQRAAKQMKQVEHRLELKNINGYRFIDDAFNANPTGSAMALKVLGMMSGKRFVVTPGMIDLGVKQAEINKRFGTYMKGNVDIAVLVGEEQTKPIYEGLVESGFDMQNVIVVKTVKEAFAYIWATASPEDTILLENDLPDAFNH